MEGYSNTNLFTCDYAMVREDKSGRKPREDNRDRRGQYREVRDSRKSREDTRDIDKPEG